MILHLINQSPLQSQALQLCLRFANAEDIVVLTEDGVIAAARDSSAASQLQHSTLNRVVALQDDLVSRGLGEKLAQGIDGIDYPEFVALCCSCDKVQSWF